MIGSATSAYLAAGQLNPPGGAATGAAQQGSGSVGAVHEPGSSPPEGKGQPRPSGEGGDRAEISEEGLRISRALGKAKAGGAEELTPEEQKMVTELKARDQEVRVHEQAHMAAGGQYIRGGATYSYQTGPDGKRYAIGGEVSIDTSREKDPEATLKKAQVVRAAAMAPAEPSGADMAAAQAADAMASEARAEIAQQQRAEATGGSSEAEPATSLAEQAPSEGEAVKSSKEAAAYGRASSEPSSPVGSLLQVAA